MNGAMTQQTLNLDSDAAERFSGALFSPDRVYRYKLWRLWNDVPEPRWCNWMMLNPSTADEFKNDPTIERCERRARKWGYDGIWITNLFAFRATDPRDMMKAVNPVGAYNDAWIWEYRRWAAITICAWGRNGLHRGRAQKVLADLATNSLWWKTDLHCLRVSEKTGQPEHPLYLPYELTPIKYPINSLTNRTR